jgi:uncharacterized protein YdbL (DUF1318 family)
MDNKTILELRIENLPLSDNVRDQYYILVQDIAKLSTHIERIEVGRYLQSVYGKWQNENYERSSLNNH